MPSITVYTKSACPYCHAAKDLLKKKGASFDEISVDGDRAGSTVPQIFVGDKHIGGCDELYDLDADGKLDALLAA
jgi:glutaredoxin 3